MMHIKNTKEFKDSKINESNVQSLIGSKIYIPSGYERNVYDDCYKLLDKSKDIKEQILKLLDSEMLKNDLLEISHRAKEKFFKKTWGSLGVK